MDRESQQPVSASAETRPTLFRDPSFWGLMATQFLGAFNDNLFKQLVLLVSVKLALDNRAENLQGLAMFAFASPFVLLSGVCGILADRHSKQRIIVLSKVLEIGAMGLGVVAFLTGSVTALMLVLSLMGAQSAFFGPAKYGILPELFRHEDLPRANGLMLMTTFISIILGVALAGQLMTWLSRDLWLASLACVITAVIGTLTALPIRKTPIAHPGLVITPGTWFISAETRKVVGQQRTLLSVLIVTSVFWCVGGVYQQGVNDLGILQLKIDEAATGLLGACAAIGIAAGCVSAGMLSQGRFEAWLVRTGLWGMLLSLVMLALPGPQRGDTLLGVYGAGAMLIVLGASAGLFAVPLTVYLQAMAPADQKGQIIGVMNFCNWIGIVLSGILHLIANGILTGLNWPPNLVFLVGTMLLIPVVIWYRPRSQALGIDAEAATFPTEEL